MNYRPRRRRGWKATAPLRGAHPRRGPLGRPFRGALTAFAAWPPFQGPKKLSKRLYLNKKRPRGPCEAGLAGPARRGHPPLKGGASRPFRGWLARLRRARLAGPASGGVDPTLKKSSGKQINDRPCFAGLAGHLAAFISVELIFLI